MLLTKNENEKSYQMLLIPTSWRNKGKHWVQKREGASKTDRGRKNVYFYYQIANLSINSKRRHHTVWPKPHSRLMRLWTESGKLAQPFLHSLSPHLQACHGTFSKNISLAVLWKAIENITFLHLLSESSNRFLLQGRTSFPCPEALCNAGKLYFKLTW